MIHYYVYNIRSMNDLNRSILFFNREKCSKKFYVCIDHIGHENNITNNITNNIVNNITSKIPNLTNFKIYKNINEIANLNGKILIDYYPINEWNYHIYDNKNESILNKYFDKIMFISLDKDIEKRDILSKKLMEMNIKHNTFEATNGYLEPYKLKYNQYKKRPLCKEIKRKYQWKMIKSPGAWGYLETWKRILEEAIKNNYKNILVFDDDVVFHKNFELKAQEYFKKIKWDTWKIIYFGASEYGWRFNVNTAKKNLFYRPGRGTDGSFAVAVNHTVFDDLLKKVNKFNIAFDSGPLRETCIKYQNDCYVSYPNIIFADVSKSSINDDRDLFEHSKRMNWNLSNFRLNNLKLKVSIIFTINSDTINDICNLEKSIHSLLNQTYYNHEILILDNTSNNTPNNASNNTSNNILNYYSKFNNIKIFKINESNIIELFNIGLKKCRGDYIIFHKSNQISKKNRLEEQISFMLRNNYNVTFFKTNDNKDIFFTSMTRKHIFKKHGNFGKGKKWMKYFINNKIINLNKLDNIINKKIYINKNLFKLA